MRAHIKVSDLHYPHAFFSRKGGVSDGIYLGLNCGPGSDDLPANVSENRRIAAKLISGDTETPVLSCYQIHGREVAVATGDWRENRPKADAMVTKTPGLILGILTADCCPVLFEDHKAGVVGAAHAGWQGAIGGVLASTVAAMEALGARRNDITAAIGPTIAQASYEVGTDFRERFLKKNQEFDAFFVDGKDSGHFQFDLPGFVRAGLKAVKVGSIRDTNTDTYTSESHFSYRRTTHRREPDYGRQLSAIMLPQGGTVL
ncbi:peptidoglycan editing factor PgeF [Kordiimonas sp.]|uniref:peptidoglycan editing factor PgeF n=1 Tax=Kordiimonas sp. TaxID=1970157 RepID=UPI003A8F8B32